MESQVKFVMAQPKFSETQLPPPPQGKNNDLSIKSEICKASPDRFISRRMCEREQKMCEREQKIEDGGETNRGGSLGLKVQR